MNAPAKALVLAATLLCGCIDRPPRDATQPVLPAPVVDRGALREVLVQQLPADLVAVNAVFGNAVELVGYKLEPPAMAPGQYARVTFYWRCKAALGESWHVFVHLDDANGSGSRLNRDHDPAAGRFPTDAWKPGDLIADPIVFPAPQTPLMLFVGLFSSGETRLPLTSPGKGRTDGTHRLLAGVLPLAGAPAPFPGMPAETTGPQGAPPIRDPSAPVGTPPIRNPSAPATPKRRP